MKPFTELTAEETYSDEVLMEVFDQEDELKKARMIIELSDQATKLKVKQKFDVMLSAYKKTERELNKQQKSNFVPTSLDQWTDFGGPYDNMICGDWLATTQGVCSRNYENGRIDTACYHPILPIERLKNLETGEEQIKLAYKRNRKWEEIIVPKTVITSANKIVSLSSRGISVTSETSRSLVRFLADVENANDEEIKLQYSTSKLGWIKNTFIPYDQEILFDGDARFGQISESVQMMGDRDKWFDCVRDIRKDNRTETKFLLAASFSSVLIQLLSGLPYFVDLWGETEGGKTVVLMLAASVWANPDESTYIKDYKGTEVGLEAVCDLLNNLPLILDDTSKKNRRIEENFEGLVYDLCSGKGKTRSNKEIGVNRESHWRNCILTNGERPLSSYVTQGGAINRILELESGKSIFRDVRGTLETIKNNYGYAGKEFIDVINTLGTDKIKSIHKEILAKLDSDTKMQKQSLSLSIILTADKIATDYLFKDGEYLDFDSVKSVLIDKDELSDNERCYRFLLDKIAMNPSKFDSDVKNTEKWGIIENGYAVIYTTAFSELCQAGKFSRASFLSWASKNDIIARDGDHLSKIKSFGGAKIRCVFLKVNNLEESTEVETDNLEDFKDFKYFKDFKDFKDFKEIEHSEMELPFLE